MRIAVQLMVGLVLLAGSLPPGRPACASELVVQVRDTDGQPVPDAVVVLGPRAGEAAAAVVDRAPALPRQVIVDQRNETFVPYVQIVPQGGEVVFRNSDLTRHHVYSFSPAKAFEFVLAPGEGSTPVVLARPGVVAVGCNIHDRMVAYLYVTDRPWAALTDAKGRAVLTGVGEGAYQLRTWHPRLRPGRPEPSEPVTVTAAGGEVDVALSLLRDPRHAPDPERARY